MTIAADNTALRSRETTTPPFACERAEPNFARPVRALPLIARLCERLHEAGIEYCHWKSNEALARSLSGANDLDLLVERGDASRFAGILGSLGFKEAAGSASRELPGIRHYYGFDDEADRFVHIHAHFQLIVGHDTTKNYRLPVERAYIASSRPDPGLRTPKPEFELILFAVRMVLKHCTFDAFLFREARLTGNESAEFHYLLARSDNSEIERVLETHFMYLGPGTFGICLEAIAPRASVGTRFAAAHRLLRALEPFGRSGRCADATLRIYRRLKWRAARVFSPGRGQKHLLNGGRLIAFIGGDGSGKSTAVAEVGNWLGKNFEVTTVHLGKPSPSAFSAAAQAFLRILRKVGAVSRYTPAPEEILTGRSAEPCGFGWVALQALIAADRHRLYRRALRLSANGRIVITDRFPLREIRCMDGVKAGRVIERGRSGWLISWLVALEEKYYRQIRPPDAAFVLRVDPEIAVQRRLDENSRFVRIRNREIFERNWAEAGVRTIDSGKPREEFIRELKREVWREL